MINFTLKNEELSFETVIILVYVLCTMTIRESFLVGSYRWSCCCCYGVAADTHACFTSLAARCVHVSYATNQWQWLLLFFWAHRKAVCWCFQQKRLSSVVCSIGAAKKVFSWAFGLACGECRLWPVASATRSGIVCSNMVISWMKAVSSAECGMLIVSAWTALSPSCSHSTRFCCAAALICSSGSVYCWLVPWLLYRSYSRGVVPALA